MHACRADILIIPGMVKIIPHCEHHDLLYLHSALTDLFLS